MSASIVSVHENDESTKISHEENSLSRESVPNSPSNCSTINNMDNPISGRFIQLIDHGKPILPNNSASGSADTTESVQPSDNNDVTVYLLDATTEDPFTLESFDTLIQQHAEKGKDFILARVTTADSLDDSKTYQSYYSAHHINKVLFRTQPEQGLLHRMKAKNPLNNMNIIGDVHYYVIKAESVRITQQSFTKSSAISISSHKTLHLNGNGIATTEISATSALDKSDGGFFINIGGDDKETLNNQQVPDGIALRKMGNTLERERRWSSSDLVQQPQRVFIPQYSQQIRRHQSMTGLHPSSSVLNSRKTDTITPLSKIITSRGDKDSIIIENEATTTTTTINTTSEKICKSDQESISPTYKAIFYATDDDFLMKSQVRQYFKTNAIDPLDSQLFSINTSTQISSATGTLGLIQPNLDDSLAVRIAPSQQYGDSALHVNRESRWARPLRIIRMNKGIKWLVLMYMIFGILLIKFVVSATYVYLMAFLLMLCLFLVFCVGSGVCFLDR